MLRVTSVTILLLLVFYNPDDFSEATEQRSRLLLPSLLPLEVSSLHLLLLVRAIFLILNIPGAFPWSGTVFLDRGRYLHVYLLISEEEGEDVLKGLLRIIIIV